MYIFIMRHFDAVPEQQNDQDRELSVYGQSQAKHSGQWLKQFCDKQSLSITATMVSPYRRAQQTLALMQKHLDVGEILPSNDIVPSSNAAVAHDYIDVLLSHRQQTQALLVVSHMPFVSYLLDTLSGHHHSMIFSTGAIACVEYDESASRGRLVSQFSPD